ncbi:Wzz/FepE/Etk N-terminal domain-containing protein [Rhodoferax sp.]|uniref:Wzz/FepE/Etk N-terminal domain-containing protein n=1 Tax=Rhodoferax sp. TaxID=50421 RepID=UPI0025DB21E9|nr:Wzz/FepE/Etk N-terminal domain-containing protein [Rhodoferax sp.]
MTYSKSNIDGEVDLFEYVALLLRYRYRMVIAAVLAAIIVYGFTFLMPVKYSAYALVAYNNYDKPGGVALKEYRGGDTVSLLERDIIIDSSSENEKERLLARFRSYAFATYFIEKNGDLLKLIYPKGWDAEKNKWKDGFEVDTRKAVDIFNKELAWVSADEKTGLLTVGFNASDPIIAANMANTVVEDFKKYQRNLVLKQLDSRRKYLESRLTITSNLEFQRSIYRMLEAQMSAETLINVRDNYPFEVIQPAITPLTKSSPQRMMFAFLTLIAVLFLGVAYVIGRELITKMSSQLKTYNVEKKIESKMGSDNDESGGWAE